MNNAKQVDAIIEELKTMQISKSERIWRTAIANVGQSYVYGAWGALCTPSERRKRLGYSPSHTTIKTKCKGFDSGNCNGCQWYPEGERTRCWDCRGFDDWCELMGAGFDLYGDTVGTQWGTDGNWIAKGTIGTLPRDILVHLFVCKDGKWTHTGLGYKGETCECSSGVQHFEKMNSKWTHWAVPRCLADEYRALYPDGFKDEPVDNGKTMEYPKLQKGNKGDSVKYLQTLLMDHGYSLPKYGADGDFGNETLKAVKAFQKANGLSQDGVVGAKTWAALISEPVDKKIYSITITGLSKEQAEELEDKYGGVITAE